MNLNQIATEITAEIQADAHEIESAADAKTPRLEPGPFGMAIAMADGSLIHAGAADTPFPIQSISKVFALSLALETHADAVFKRVGREPSGDPFNSVIDLERTCGVPRNPFINAGALVIVDMLVEQFGDGAKDAVFDLVRGGIDDPAAKTAVTLDEEVLNEGGDLNRAMLHFMLHHDNVRSPIDAVMEAYARQCAVYSLKPAITASSSTISTAANISCPSNGSPPSGSIAPSTRSACSAIRTACAHRRRPSGGTPSIG